MPGVTVTATNTQTNEAASAVTSGEGLYSLPFLRPGIYTVTAELEGFRKYSREKVQLEVGQAQTINIALEIGTLTEVVSVVSEAIEASKADRGMVIDNMRVTELPLNARNPFMLSYLSPGITYNGPAIYQRPFDNGAIADWSINGGQNRNNEFLLDGAPNNSIQGGNNIAYVPPVDAVQEFKIVTNSYDAQYGRTAGGVINVSLKSGTNTLHGTVYEFARRKAFDSDSYQFKLNNTPKPDHKLDQYGFQVDGPVRIPGLYDGRNKTFFMFNYEGYKEATPNAATYTVPDDAQLRGDFSNLRDAQGRLITIYDPTTGRAGQLGRVRSRSVPQQSDPGQSHRPDGGAVRPVFPAAEHRRAPAGTDPWRSNYFFAPNLAFDTFHNYATKVDQNISEKTRMFVRYAYNKRTEERYTNGITTGPAQDGQLPLERTNQDGSLRLGAHRQFFLGVQRPRRTEPVPRVGAFGSRVELQPVRARLSVVARQFAAEQGVPASELLYHRHDGRVSAALGRNSRNSETTTGFSLQPNFSWTQGQAQRPRRPRHADDLVHARDQHQPVRHQLRPALHAAGLQRAGAR